MVSMKAPQSNLWLCDECQRDMEIDEEFDTHETFVDGKWELINLCPECVEEYLLESATIVLSEEDIDDLLKEIDELLDYEDFFGDDK